MLGGSRLKPRFFPIHYIFYTILMGFVVFSVVGIVTATTPNPGHPWAEVGDGVFAVTNNQTAVRTYTFPDANATVLTTNALVTVAQGGIGVGTLASNGVLYGNGTGAVQALAVNAGATQCLTQASSGAPAWGSCGGTVRWDQIAAPTAALSLTMPATNETTFTEQSTTQTGFTWTSSTITSGMLGKFSLTGTSAVATAASSGSLLTLASTTTGFTAATQSLVAVNSSGTNSNSGVTIQGITSTITNANGTSGTNIAGYFSASGATTGNYAIVVPSGGGSVGIGTITPTAIVDIVQPVITTGSPSGLKFTGGVHTTLANAEASDINLNLARLVQFTGGASTTIALQRATLLQAPTYRAATTGLTITDAATLALTGAPIKSTNTAITTTHGLYIGSNAVSTASYSSGLTVNAQTGATVNNYAAQFLGGGVSIDFPKMSGSNKFQVSSGTYSTGTAVAAGAACTATNFTTSSYLITGSGTSWTDDMVFGQIAFANGTTLNIVAYVDTTHVCSDQSTTASSQAYTIYKPGQSIGTNGNTTLGSFYNASSNSRLYVGGGQLGANIDVRGINAAFKDQSVIELEGSDYDQNYQSVLLQYYGQANSGGTTMGYTNVDLGVLKWGGTNAQNAIIYTATNSDIHFGTNALERMVLDKNGNLGLFGTASGLNPSVGALLDVSPTAYGSITAEKPIFRVVPSTITITGSYATERFSRLEAPTITAGSSLTVTNADTLNIGSIPVAGGSAAITGSTALRIPVAPQASANVGLVSIGNGVWDGASAGKFAGSSSGTDIAINNPTGYAGNFVDFQVNGVSKAKIDSAGALTVVSCSGCGSMVYPGAGIPNSTGSAWGTSYTTTGSGTVVALATSPSLTTSVIGGVSFDAFNTVSTTLNIGGAATTFALGGTPTSALTANIFTNATASGQTKTINLGTGGAASSTTTINIGSANGGTTTVNSPLTSTGLITASAGFTSNGTVTVSAGQNFTMPSGAGTFTQTSTGTTTDAHTVTANLLTTGNALKVAFTQNSGAAAGNTASGLNIAAATPTNTGNTTSLINLSAAGTNGTINGIEFTGTNSNFTNLIKGTNFTVTSAGALSSNSTLSGTQITSTISTGTAPFVVSSTTNVANLNASSLGGATFAAPGPIGSGTPGTGAFTTLTSNGASTIATGASLTNTFGSGSSNTNTIGGGASSVNTIGAVTTPGALTLHGATTLDNTFTVSGSNLTSLGGNLTVTGTAWTATPTISGLITASSGISIATGQQETLSNFGAEFTESDTNPTCAAGNYTIYADLSETKLKKCTNGTVSDLDTTGGGGVSDGDKGDIVVSGSGATWLIDADVIDWADIADATTLDAATSIAFGGSTFNLLFTNDGSGNEIHNLTSTGDLLIQDSNTTFATFADDGNITFAPTGTSDFTINQAAGVNTNILATAVPTVDMLNISNSGFANTNAGISGLQITYVGGAAAVEASGQRIDITGGTTAAGIWNGLRIVQGTVTTATTVQDLKLETGALTQTAANTTSIAGLNLSTAGALVQNTAAGTINWKGIAVQMPAITQTTGTINTDGLYVAMSTLTTGGKYRAINVVDSSANTIFEVKDTSTATNNFGGLAMTGAFIGRNSYYGQEYNVFRTAYTAVNTTANSDRCRGDAGSSFTAVTCTAGTGEVSLNSVVGNAAGTNNCTYSSVTGASNTNGAERISAISTAATGGNTSSCLQYLGAGATLANKLFIAANLPVVSMKVTPSTYAAATTSKMIVGLGMGTGSAPTVTAGMPIDGIFFTNCTTYSTTAPTCPSATPTWHGFVVAGSALVGTVQDCPAGAETGNIVQGKTSYMRIEVRSTTDIHFFIDTDTSTGIVETECGTGVTGTAPSNGLTMWLQVNQNAATVTTVAVDVDYFRVYQDEAAEGSGGFTDSLEPPVTVIAAPSAFDGRIALTDLIAASENLAYDPTVKLETQVLYASKGVITPNLTADTAHINTIASGKEGGDIGLILDGSGKFIIGPPQKTTRMITNPDGTTREEIIVSAAPVITFDNLGNATFAGTLSAKQIKVGDISGIQEITNQINNLAEGQQAFILTAQAMNSLTQALTLAQTDIAKLQQDLQTTIDGLSTNGADVENRLKIIEGFLTKDENGVINGFSINMLTVTGDSSFAGKAQFDGLSFFSNTTSFAGGVTFSGVTEFALPPLYNKDSAGYALIKEGDRRAVIMFESPYIATPIVNTSVTFEDTDNVDDSVASTIFADDIRFIIVNKNQTGFTILLNKPAIRDVRFSWNALSVKDPKIFKSVFEGLMIDPTQNTTTESPSSGEENGGQSSEDQSQSEGSDSSGVNTGSENGESGSGGASSDENGNTGADGATSI